MEAYILLAKGQKGRALVELIKKATSDAAVFGFRELLAVPSIQDIQHGELAPHHALLRFFAYGVWSDYKGQAAALPELTEPQRTKLKQLTLISLALKIKVISYQVLQEQLDIPTVRQLEDFIITECFYTSIVAGKLDQRKACLLVQNVIGRDVQPEQLPELEAGLQNWVQAAEGVLHSIEGRVENSAAAAAQYKKEREAVEAQVAAVKATLKGDLQDLSRADMMLDEPPGDLMDEDRVGGAGGGGWGGAPGAGGADRADRLAGKAKRRLR